ncbi:hypothetical protein E2C01_017600 [Portunus trituberculatus]|uniref:Uncharacterized protein n=1 Tax=Portunus trituberculatus TaxID=210409 RepID=A0A5B7DU92_PORTR|nr:hypothetical protein [Portunus trituberculatus]
MLESGGRAGVWACGYPTTPGMVLKDQGEGRSRGEGVGRVQMGGEKERGAGWGKVELPNILPSLPPPYLAATQYARHTRPRNVLPAPTLSPCTYTPFPSDTKESGGKIGVPYETLEMCTPGQTICSDLTTPPPRAPVVLSAPHFAKPERFDLLARVSSLSRPGGTWSSALIWAVLGPPRPINQNKVGLLATPHPDPSQPRSDGTNTAWNPSLPPPALHPALPSSIHDSPRELQQTDAIKSVHDKTLLRGSFRLQCAATLP